MQKIKGESNYEFEQRKLFYDFLSSKKVKDIEKLSKVWANIKFRKCRYSSSLYNFLMKLDKDFSDIKVDL